MYYVVARYWIDAARRSFNGDQLIGQDQSNGPFETRESAERFALKLIENLGVARVVIEDAQTHQLCGMEGVGEGYHLMD